MSSNRVPVLAALALANLVACTPPGERHVSPSELAEMEAAEPSSPMEVPTSSGFMAALQDANPAAAADSKQRDEFDDRALELARRREDHDLAVAAFNDELVQTDLTQETARRAEEQKVAQAERTLRFAREDLQRFEEIDRPRRLVAAELDLQSSFNRLLQQREEMAQLEMMYSESDLGDATAEIVLSRGRRQLELMEQRYQMDEQRRDTVRDLDLPREHQELQAKVMDGETALVLAQRALEAGRLSRAAARTELDLERMELARELEDLERALARYTRDVDAWQRELVEQES